MPHPANTLARRAVSAALLAGALLLSTLALTSASALASTRATDSATSTAGHNLLQSRLLWATIDVCNPVGEPNTVGIRGSMPGDLHVRDTMYMRFRLQYMDPTTKQWVDLAKAASGYVNVGSGASPRQGGRSFKLGAPTGRATFMMRGVVGFQWRHGTRVLTTASRPTSSGRESLAGAVPAGFSAASCLLS